MKTLYITRHAKSSWVDITKSDFDRPLNDRGNKDAPEMARRLLKRREHIDLFVSSPAVRAKKTCKLFCEEFGADPNDIVYIDRLYLASSETLYDVVRNLDNKYSYVAIFCHNPGITDFVNSLCANVRVDNVPTAGVFSVDMDIREWKDIKPHKCSYKFFDYPKANR